VKLYIDSFILRSIQIINFSELIYLLRDDTMTPTRTMINIPDANTVMSTMLSVTKQKTSLKPNNKQPITKPVKINSFTYY